MAVGELEAAWQATADKQHRLCLVVRARGLEASARRSLVQQVADFCHATHVLHCSRHGLGGDVTVPGIHITVWAFGQVQKSGCLGQSFHAVVLFDLEEIMPETLWAAVETVRGGGVVCFVIPEQPLLTSRHGFFPRLIAALHEEAHCWHVGADWEVLRPGWVETSSTLEERPIVQDSIPSGGHDALDLAALRTLTCTSDQQNALTVAVEALVGGHMQQVVITGRRGRGKSTVVGLIAAGAIARCSFTSLIIAAPSPENVSELLLSARRGLAALGIGCSSLGPSSGAFYATWDAESEKRTVQVLVVRAETLSQLLSAFATTGHSTLLILDEVASVPITTWKALSSAPVQAIVMAGTTSGCEGTGCALEWKVLDGMASKGSEQIRLVLEEPVRYARGCPVEALLDSLIFLGANADIPLHNIDVDCDPCDTQLWALDSSAMVSGHGASDFAKAVAALLQTHYRTSASDVTNMLVQEYMCPMVLVAAEGKQSVPLVVLVCIHEAPELLPAERGSSRLSRSHLTTFCLEQDFPELNLSMVRGLRIARIVCDPRLRGRGFGSEAVNQLVSHLNGSAMQEECARSVASTALLRPLKLSEVAWLGASFGMTGQLLRFWSRLEFQPVALSPVVNPQTGEVSVVMLRPLQGAGLSLEACLECAPLDFRRRLLQRLPAVDRSVPVSLLATLLSLKKASPAQILRLGPSDLAHLQRLALSRDPLPCLAHSGELLRHLCEAYYLGQLAPLQLRREDEELLVAFGRLADAATEAVTANQTALAAKRIAGEVAKRLAVGLNKEVRVCLIDVTGQEWSTWLPAGLQTPEGPTVVRSKTSDASLLLRLHAHWTYPVEAECGELALQVGFHNIPSREARAGPRQLEAQLFHRWQVQELTSSLREAGPAETLLQLNEAINLPVQLVSPVPDPADVYLNIRLFETFMSSYSARGAWGSAWMPLKSVAQEESTLQLALEVADGVLEGGEPRLNVTTTWQYPLLYNGSKPQRGRGLLQLTGLATSGIKAPCRLRVEVHVLHYVQSVRACLEEEDVELQMRVRLKQNRPASSKT